MSPNDNPTPPTQFRWLDRSTVFAPYMTLCLSEEEFLAAAKHCEMTFPDPWLDPNMGVAAVHTWEDKGKVICIVCLGPLALEMGPIGVAGSLVHESVHIFQHLCKSIGEGSPSKEFEAYSIERISTELMHEYARRIQV